MGVLCLVLVLLCVLFSVLSSFQTTGWGRMSGLLYFMLPMSYDYKCYVVLPYGAVCWSQFVIVDMSCIKFRGSHHNAQ